MMKQLSLPGLFSQKVVNVASVPHRSPFRYPGGKTWLVPRVRTWLQSLQFHPATIFEPFAGGGIVGLTVAFEQLADQVTLVELDEQVAAVWQTIIEDGDGTWLADNLLSFDLTAASVDALLQKTDLSTKERALQTIVRNRVNRGGILAKGAGKLKYGENGRGLRSRWYPQTLAHRIRDIDRIRDRLSFVHGDGLAVIEAHSEQVDAAFFVDPPYTASSKRPGSRLYDCSQLDHERLFQLMAAVKGDFLMTYDNVDEIRQLACRHQFDCEAVPMKNTHHAQLSELLIGRNLNWARN